MAQSVAKLDRAPQRPGTPSVLLLLDEFAALGRLEPVLSAAGLMAGLGLQLWPILQDLTQLRAAYGDSASTFLANAGLVQVSTPADLDTATWLSRVLGNATVQYETTSAGSSRPAGLGALSGGTSSVSEGTSYPPDGAPPPHPGRGYAPVPRPRPQASPLRRPGV